VKHFEIPPYSNYSFNLIQNSDFEKLALFRRDYDIMLALDKEVETDEEILSLIDQMHSPDSISNSLWWFIYLDNVLIGNFGLKLDRRNARAEIGYVLFKAYWKIGHMSNCLPILLDFAFNNLGCHSLEARINPLNIGSKKLLLANNFVLEGSFKEDYFYKGNFLDTQVYSLLIQNHVPRETIQFKK
jgi:ribosomal-protein-alanine N-acetyltransferase